MTAVTAAAVSSRRGEGWTFGRRLSTATLHPTVGVAAAPVAAADVAAVAVVLAAAAVAVAVAAAAEPVMPAPPLRSQRPPFGGTMGWPLAMVQERLRRPL